MIGCELKVICDSYFVNTNQNLNGNFSELYEKLPKTLLSTAHGNYVIFNIGVRHITAYMLCEIIGHLVIIDSKEEFDAVVPRGSAKYWIDLFRYADDTSFVATLTGKSGYQEWNSLGPGNTTLEKCVFIADKKMENSLCSAKLGFICEIK